MFHRSIIVPLLYWICNGDAEKVHEMTLQMLRHPLAPALLTPFASPLLRKPVELFGVTFRSRVGLAAGFDKNAVALLALQKLFGFVKIGTVTPHPQVGNPKPRIFRLPEDRALINRLGFNSDGADAVSQRLEEIAKFVKVPIGGSWGKMRETPNEEAADDYISVHLKLRSRIDFAVVNTSSPNTPGLRELQTKQHQERFLSRITQAEQEAARIRGERPKPILVKLSPDLTDEEAADAFEASILSGIAGLIVGNSTLYRENLASPHRRETGGVSGAPLTERVQQRVAFLRRLDARFPIIGVGGIMEPQHATILLDLGADLVELFAGFVYGGIGFPRKVTRHVNRYC